MIYQIDMKWNFGFNQCCLFKESLEVERSSKGVRNWFVALHEANIYLLLITVSLVFVFKGLVYNTNPWTSLSSSHSKKENAVTYIPQLQTF